jgi:hypothetical protein
MVFRVYVRGRGNNQPGLGWSDLDGGGCVGERNDTQRGKQDKS